MSRSSEGIDQATVAQRLAELRLFAALDTRALHRIALDVVERTCAPGQVISLEGGPCRAAHFIVRGSVRTRRLSPEGREYVLAYLGPGQCFDLIPVLDGGTCLDTADAITPVTLYAIPCRRFRELVREQPALAHELAGHLAGEVRRMSEIVKDLSLHTVRTRLASFLLAHAEDTSPRKRWTQEIIAAQVGTVRDVVGRTLRAFAQEGLIRRERGRLVIVDRAALAREAQRP